MTWVMKVNSEKLIYFPLANTLQSTNSEGTRRLTIFSENETWIAIVAIRPDPYMLILVMRSGRLHSPGVKNLLIP
jgi:hypothetical protein